jgi:hypothetical protein
VPSLHIDFQEGWTGSDVVVTVNGRERRLETVTTKTQIGLAAQVVEEVEPGAVAMTVTAPGAGLVGEHRVDVTADHWVGVSVANGRVLFRDQDELFGYV